MVDRPTQNVAVFGSTGSIGRSTLDVLKSLRKTHTLFAVAAHRSLDAMEEQIDAFHPKHAIATDVDFARGWAWGDRLGPTKRWVGESALIDIASDPELDTLVAAVVGSAGLSSCLAAAEAGKRLALANKEALVVAGPLLTAAVRKGNAKLLPVDSEHSAIFQALHSGSEHHEVRSLILTASGGSLRDWPIQDLAKATAEDALAHPNWKMGKKITIDSATMMNKALEIIEARWLFGVDASQIKVVIHPQSIVHSMVEFVDGSVVAQLSPPDMRLPIQYALTYPNRLPCPSPGLNWEESLKLDWHPADMERYPALELGFEVAREGGTCGAVLNAANETAVQLFLDGKLSFPQIVDVNRAILHHHRYNSQPTLTELMDLDRWARKETIQWARSSC